MGPPTPIALEGALKLEISYIHAEAYPAGELKHGPLALVTADAGGGGSGNDALLEKLKSNIRRCARAAAVFCRADDGHPYQTAAAGVHVIRMPEHYGALSRSCTMVPLQLLAYHTLISAQPSATDQADVFGSGELARPRL